MPMIIDPEVAVSTVVILGTLFASHVRQGITAKLRTEENNKEHSRIFTEVKEIRDHIFNGTFVRKVEFDDFKEDCRREK